MSEIDLKSCPFCGSPAATFQVGPATHDVSCSGTGCNVVIAFGATYEEAAAAWNRRASDTESHPGDHELADRLKGED